MVVVVVVVVVVVEEGRGVYVGGGERGGERGGAMKAACSSCMYACLNSLMSWMDVRSGLVADGVTSLVRTKGHVSAVFTIQHNTMILSRVLYCNHRTQ